MMARLREFGKYGDTDVIKLKPIDKTDLDLEYGDLIDIEGLTVNKEEKGDEQSIN